jgi:hypothetical protein
MDEGRYSPWRTHLARILVIAAVSMTVNEFVEFQKLAPDELRTRFGLPASCDPAVTALTTDPTANRVNVAIECRPRPGQPPSSSEPTDRQRPERLPAKGS